MLPVSLLDLLLVLTDWFSCCLTSHSTQTTSFRRCFPQANLLALYGKTLNLTQHKHGFANKKKCTTTQTQKITARFSRLFRHPAWKRSGFIFSKEKISKGRNKKKVKKKGQAYDINKQTTNTAPKTKIESRVHYATKPAQGQFSSSLTVCLTCFWSVFNFFVDR